MKTNNTSRIITGVPLYKWNVSERGVIECYISDCPAYIKRNSVFVEIAYDRVLCVNYSKAPTTQDIELLGHKINHLKSINYERFKN